jgi:hypothetical protein
LGRSIRKKQLRPVSRWRIPASACWPFRTIPAIAGGNVFVLGQTFDNTAGGWRAMRCANGKSKVLIVHDRNVAGDVGKRGDRTGRRSAGGSVAGVTSYEFSQNGIVQAASGIVALGEIFGRERAVPDGGHGGRAAAPQPASGRQRHRPGTTQFIGLTRWDIPPATLSLPGVQGGWFAMPDPGLQAQFQRALPGSLWHGSGAGRRPCL